MSDQDDLHPCQLFGGDAALFPIERQYRVLDEFPYIQAGLTVGLQPVVACAPDIELVFARLAQVLLVQLLYVAQFLAVIGRRVLACFLPPTLGLRSMNDPVQSAFHQRHDGVVGRSHDLAPAAKLRGLFAQSGVPWIDAASIIDLHIFSLEKFLSSFGATHSPDEQRR
ncbi:hypothetical protein D9M68_617830 [compost metagenome]